MLGHTDHADELIAAISGQANDKNALKELQRIDVLSWLPAEKRLIECQRRFAELANQPEPMVELLRQCTLIDDPAIAEWIVEHVGEMPLADRSLRAPIARIVIRSQL